MKKKQPEEKISKAKTQEGWITDCGGIKPIPMIELNEEEAEECTEQF